MNISYWFNHNKVVMFIFKFVISIICYGFALIPLWLFLWIKNSLNPTTFIEKFLVYGAGVWLLGGIQLVLFIACTIFVIFAIVCEGNV